MSAQVPPSQSILLCQSLQRPSGHSSRYYKTWCDTWSTTNQLCFSRARHWGAAGQPAKHSFFSGKWWLPAIIPNNCTISEKCQGKSFQGNHTKATRERETPNKTCPRTSSLVCLPHLKWKSQDLPGPWLLAMFKAVLPFLSFTPDIWHGSNTIQQEADAHMCVQSQACGSDFCVSFLFMLKYCMKQNLGLWLSKREAGKK